MTRLLTALFTALLIVLATIPITEFPESVAADGVTFQPRGRCIEVSNRKRLIRVNCEASDQVSIETGDFPFGVTFGADTSGDEPTRRPRRPGGGDDGNGGDCHPAYTGCLPNLPGDALNCADIGDRQVRLRDVNDDPYNLDAVNRPGNGITCDDIG